MKYYPLTIPQQNIWNLQKYYPDTAVANLCGAIFFGEKRESARLQQVISLFVRSQSGMRLRFQDGERPVQYVAEDVCGDIPVLEFADREEFDRYAESFAQNPIGLADRAMYRFVVFQIAGESGILAALSHLIADAWTFGLMAKRIDEAYRDLEMELEGDYTQFIQAEGDYLLSERFQRDKAFWEKKYGMKDTPVEKDIQVEVKASFEKSIVKLCAIPPASISAKRLTKTLTPDLARKLSGFCEKSNVTQAVLFETAVIIYLAKLNNENRNITIGVPVLNRGNAREKATAGMFVSTMPLTVPAEKDMTAIELAKLVAKGHMEIFRHQKYPYADILRSLRQRQNVSGNLYDVIVSFQNARTEANAETKWYSNGYCEVPLEIHIDNRDGNECPAINMDYQTEVIGEDEADYLLGRL